MSNGLGIRVLQNTFHVSPEELAGLRIDVEPRLIPFTLSAMLHVERSPGCTPPLTTAEAESLVEILDKVVASTVYPSLKNRCFYVLREVSATHGILPKSYFPHGVTLTDTNPHTSGRFSDTWEGQQSDGNQVCVKAFRAQTAENLYKIKRRFYREIVVWKHISHPNVLPFLGVSETLFPFCMISPWLRNGAIVEYIRKHRAANRLQLLAQAASGLEHLHSLRIVHGDVNPGNILVTEEGNACLGDFGITRIIADPSFVEPGSTTSPKPGVVRYMAPELLNPVQLGLKNANPSTESDIYSLAMTAYEILTDILPYGNVRDGIIVYRVVTGDRPPRPKDAQWLQDHIWNMITSCWSEKSDRRWDIRAMYNQLSVSSTQEITTVELEVATLTGAPPRDQPLVLLPAHGGSPYERLASDPLNLSTDQRTSLIAAIFSDRSEVEKIRRLCKNDAQILVDIIYEALGNLDHALRTRCLRFLCKICGRETVLPRPLAIVVSWDRTEVPLCHGGFADVWKGRFHDQEVAVKVPRLYQCSDYDRIRRRFCKEVVMWSALRHPNVLPLLGVTMTSSRFTMMSEWMVNGNANDYVKACPDADRYGIVGLANIFTGLVYLHDQGMVHGDLKGANVLIDRDGNARIADFGLLTIISDQANLISSISHSEGGTARWMSPELLDPERFGLKDGRPTKESDIYALGMVVYEVLRGQLPFPECNAAVVIRKVMDGERPGRPEGSQGAWFTDELWEMLERCWKPQRGSRPSLGALLNCLKGVVPPSQPPSPILTASDDGTESDDALVSAVANADVFPISPEPRRSAFNHPQDMIGRTVKLGGGQLMVPPINTPRDAMHTILGGEENQWRMALALPTCEPSTSALLRQIARWDGSSLPEMNQMLNSTFKAQDYQDHIKDLRGQDIDPQLYINGLDQIINILPLDTDIRKCSIRALKKTCMFYRLLPARYAVASRISQPGPDSQPSASGEFSDVWKLINECGRALAVKSLRPGHHAQSTEELNKRFYTEVLLGKHMTHPNILPIEGVTPQFSQLCVVSEWMVNGDMLQYITRQPGVDHLELLFGITRGLNHLHKNGIIHKNLKCTNILIDGTGSPRLHICNIRGGVSRYLAPEHYLYRPDAERQKMTTKCDVYSLSMIIVGLVTKNVPFPGLTNHNVMILVSNGRRPQKPRRIEAPGLTPEVWKIAEMCWHGEPGNRPEVSTVLQRLEDLPKPDTDTDTPVGNTHASSSALFPSVESSAKGASRQGKLSFLHPLYFGRKR